MADPVESGIEIRNLYKIFGANPRAHVEAVRAGMSKTELNEKHGHVLGLRDINISMPAGCIQVIKQLPLKTFVTFDARANPGQGIASAGPRANISCKNLSAPAVVLGCSQSPAQSLEQPKQSLARKRRGT